MWVTIWSEEIELGMSKERDRVGVVRRERSRLGLSRDLGLEEIEFGDRKRFEIGRDRVGVVGSERSSGGCRKRENE